MNLDYEDPTDPLPTALLDARGLPTLAKSLRALHRPMDLADDERELAALLAGRSQAHRRLAYGDLLGLRMRVEEARRGHHLRLIAPRHRRHPGLLQAWQDRLPFTLTAAQRRVLEEILEDLATGFPMQRLVQGDVGCGKTVVAAIAAAAIIQSGFQVALLAPTELLAEQHHRSLSDLLQWTGCRTGLFTSSSAQDSSLLESGEIDLAIGTHALLQESVGFQRLGLVIIDEQQRFGVQQRRRLLETRSDPPDLLVMSATPIPRSLAMTLYGDLQVSVIDEMPPGRRPITTALVSEQRRPEVYESLCKRLQSDAGRAYVVFPFIDDSGGMRGATLAREGEQARHWLAPHRCGVVHGRLNAEERQAVMDAFSAGRTRVLLATSVIEVGVDVPEACFMVIESAERFGLSQLHQLRGRIGRVGRRPRASPCTENSPAPAGNASRSSVERPTVSRSHAPTSRSGDPGRCWAAASPESKPASP